MSDGIISPFRVVSPQLESFLTYVTPPLQRDIGEVLDDYDNSQNMEIEETAFNDILLVLSEGTEIVDCDMIRIISILDREIHSSCCNKSEPSFESLLKLSTKAFDSIHVQKSLINTLIFSLRADQIYDNEIKIEKIFEVLINFFARSTTVSDDVKIHLFLKIFEFRLRFDSKDGYSLNSVVKDGIGHLISTLFSLGIVSVDKQMELIEYGAFMTDSEIKTFLRSEDLSLAVLLQMCKSSYFAGNNHLEIGKKILVQSFSIPSVNEELLFCLSDLMQENSINSSLALKALFDITERLCDGFDEKIRKLAVGIMFSVIIEDVLSKIDDDELPGDRVAVRLTWDRNSAMDILVKNVKKHKPEYKMSFLRLLEIYLGRRDVKIFIKNIIADNVICLNRDPLFFYPQLFIKSLALIYILPLKDIAKETIPAVFNKLFLEHQFYFILWLENRLKSDSIGKHEKLKIVELLEIIKNSEPYRGIRLMIQRILEKTKIYT